MKIRLFILFFIFSIANCFSQQWFELKGKLYSNDSSSVVYGAVIFNKSRLLGTLSNSIGNFKMRVQKGDTLEISHISHHKLEIIVDHPEETNNKVFTIVLIQKMYELPSIDIARYRIRQKQALPVTMRRTDNITIDMGSIKLGLSENVSGGANYPTNSNIPSIFPAFGVPIGDWNMNKRLKQYEKIAELEAKNIYQKKVELRYNKDVVNRLTGLKGNELEQFMNYCKPPSKTIFNESEYELTAAILACYEKFRIEFDD